MQLSARSCTPHKTNKQRCQCRYIFERNQNHAEPSDAQSPGRSRDAGARRRGHLPGNLSCSDYTMCLASLWAILPFCSVKYKRHSGKGKGLEESRAYQFTTFEFTEPGAGILLYPGCEPSLGGMDRGGGGGGENSVKERTQIGQTHPLPVFLLLFVL